MTKPSYGIKPDEILPPDGTSVQMKGLLKDAALLLPNLVKLVGRLLRDPRVPRRSKITLGMAAAYVASPIDLIPEVVPLFGWADDVVILMFAIDRLIDRAGPELVEEHWDGPGDLLSLVRDVVSFSRSVLPRRLRAAMDRLAG
jgi:uncharacterized membrane protein YkvA (DUF1232 family)